MQLLHSFSKTNFCLAQFAFLPPTGREGSGSKVPTLREFLSRSKKSRRRMAIIHIQTRYSDEKAKKAARGGEEDY